MNKINNKGFAISTLIYGTFILFMMILAILLASLNSSLRLLDDRVNTVGDYEINEEGDLEPPDLSTGLIPVVYDAENKTENGTGWFVADISDPKNWYNYDEQWWANGVSVKDTSKNNYVESGGTYISGEEISSEDWLAMFVWIPRFSYTIGCLNSNTECYGYRLNNESDKDSEKPSKSFPGAIDIKFIKKNTNPEDPGVESLTYPRYRYTSSNRNPTNWYTHPAFWWDEDNDGVREENEELSGIWVGKFETSVDKKSKCYEDDLNSGNTNKNYCVFTDESNTPRILPNYISLHAQYIRDKFEIAKKITSHSLYSLVGDSHMMKNSEWSAVVYLTQSTYGKYGNKMYYNGNEEVYNNNYYNSDLFWSNSLTGISSGSVKAEKSTTISFEYNDINDRGNGLGQGGGGASTTGNIYGIYDMNGGTHECMMAVNVEQEETFYYGSRSSTNTGNIFTSETKPEKKYYDLYLGDFLGDSLKFNANYISFVGHSTFEADGWYSNEKSVGASSSYITRGGYYSKGGLFYFDNMNVPNCYNTSFRVIINKLN